jgi:Na+/proline symporter
MHYLSIDYLIVYTFFFITLVIGLRAGKDVRNMREYVLANKTFGSVALAMTYLATNIAGASIFDTMAVVFADEAIRVVALLALFFAFMFHAFFIAPRVAHFPDCLTMGDLMETFYGKSSKVIAGLLGLLTAFCIATMELSMLGEVSASLLGWHRSWTIVLGGGILLALYAAYGGIKSVTATDVFKFLFLLIAIPAIAIITMEEAGGMKAVFLSSTLGEG